MKSLLQTLDSNESILLMYLADELPPEERAEVDSLLVSDTVLRHELESMRAMQSQLEASFVAADVDARPISSNDAVARQTDSLLQKWNTRRILMAPPVRRRRSRWPLYGAGVAAAVLFGWIGYWGIWGKVATGDYSAVNTVAVNSDDGSPPPTPAGNDAAVADRTDLLQRSFEAGQSASDDGSHHADISAAEDQIQQVAELSDPRSINGDLDFH